MTTLEAEPAQRAAGPVDGAVPPAPRPLEARRRGSARTGGGHLARILLVWLVAALGSLLLVLYLVEPLFQQRTQHSLLAGFRADISHAHYQVTLPGGSGPAVAPSLGASVGVLEIPGLRLRQVVVEGVGPTQTAKGPGHVPGTAGLGQPGNSAVVGRRSTYGGPFHALDSLHRGDRILVTTTQGQSVYSVTSVTNETITSSTSTDSGLGSPGATTPPVTSQFAPNPVPSRATTVDDLYAPTKASQLTLATSSRVWPGNRTQGTVVVATMKTVPFVPTAQNGRTTGQTGLSGDGSAWVGLVLALQGFVLAGLGAAYLLPRYGPRVAYLLTTPPLIVFVILIAETASQLLPAWY